MNVNEQLPVKLACAVIGAENYRTLHAHVERNAVLRFVLISAALISQIIGLLLVCFLGIVLGSAAFSLLG